jgi:hypothetical protein
MDFSSMLGYVSSLAMLYAWTLFAAGLFALGERVCRSVFAPGRPAAGGDQDRPKA